MKFLFFDCDGVLVDTEAVAAKVVTRWFAGCGYSVSEDQFISEHTGKTFGAIFKELVENGSLQQEYWKDDTIHGLEHTIYENITVVDGIEECLAQLINHEKAVISNSRAIMVKKALKATSLDKYLDVNRIFSSEIVARPKPDPGVYTYALQSFRLNPGDCYAIEDSLTGVRAATGAGIKTLGFAGASHLQEGHDEQLLKAGAFAVAYHASEIPSILK